MRKSLLGNIPTAVRQFPFELLKNIDGAEIADLIEKFCSSGNQRDVAEQLEHANLERNQEQESEQEEALVSDEEFRKYDPKFARFTKLFGNFDKKRAYVLITSAVRKKCPGLGNIALIPWLRVFDFDPKSRISGILSVTEQVLTAYRFHTKSDRLDSIELPDDKTTNWVFINGYTDSPDFIQPENHRIPESAIFKHAESLVEYCIAEKVPVILVMWYPRYTNIDDNLDIFLSGIRHHFMGRLDSFNCIVCVEKMPDKHSRLYGMLRRLNLLDDTLVVPLEILCHWLKTSFQQISAVPSTAKTLPKYPDEGSTLIKAEVTDQELQWIDVHFDILVAINSTKQMESPDTKESERRGLGFLKGEEISWDVIQHGVYDVTRDLLVGAKTFMLERHIQNGKSGLVTIFHSPGGGGSTFARRLLWELHEVVPCVELTSGQLLLGELESRLMFIRNLTRLPTVMLLDGKSMHDVKKILAICWKLRVIVLHVQRYYGLEKASSEEGKFYLPAAVSDKEADGFCQVYSNVAQSSKSSLGHLTSSIKSGKDHFVFEYGLTAFQSEFRGVIRYVHGYLQIKPNEEPENWHTVLVFLSLANYFGHRGLPSKLFSKILSKSSDETVELCDLPHSACQFITEDSGNNSWRITHYIVSKVILEQVFVRRHTINYELNKQGLTKQAASKLCEWALYFIDNVKNFVGSVKVPGHVSEVLTAIFIRRNYKDPGENELERSRTSYSRLLEETCNKVDQGKILKKLVDCFPSDAEFWAHLGRFHSKQAEFTEAESCFTQAINIRRTRLYEKPETKSDDVMERIYNMSGFCYISHVRHKIGVRLGNIKARTLSGKNLPALIRPILEKAKRAIENFDNGRTWYQNASNPSFANLGELKVRLQVTELAKQISGGDYKVLLNKASPYKELAEFALKSFHACDQLLTYCINHSHRIDVPEQEMDQCFNLFNCFYVGATAALEQWAGRDSSVHSKRCHLSVLKMKLKQERKTFHMGQDVKTNRQVMDLVELYEGICDDVCKSSTSNLHISSYMTEWLQAIRHKNMLREYTYTDVLTRVKKWKDKKEIGSLANFYHYVLTTLLSLSSVSREMANTYSEQACRSKERLMQSDLIPLYLLDTTEWLTRHGDSQDIKNLTPSSGLGEWKGKFFTDAEKISRLEIRTGTIFYCKPHDGKIVIDGGHNPSVVIFFVPQKYGFAASHSKQKTRVEFYVGFNPRHGAEAYEVTSLRKFTCPNKDCKTPTEIPMLGKNPGNCVAECNLCETLVKAMPN